MDAEAHLDGVPRRLVERLCREPVLRELPEGHPAGGRVEVGPLVLVVLDLVEERLSGAFLPVGERLGALSPVEVEVPHAVALALAEIRSADPDLPPTLVPAGVLPPTILDVSHRRPLRRVVEAGKPGTHGG